MGTWDESSLLTGAASTVEWHDVAVAWRSDARLLLFDRSGCVAYSNSLVALSAANYSLNDDDLFLGSVDGTAWFARQTDDCGPAASPRSVDLAPWEQHLVTRASALFEWHATVPRCDACGAQTSYRPGGASRVCEACGLQAFPRTDPAIIVAVLDDADRLLLAHHTAWDEGRVSVLAGFVEAGESVEQACHREIAEESGLQVSALRFFGSQPWPYPRSLMLGFVARASGDLRVDGVELDWGRFFDRETLRFEEASGRLILPGHASIASRMIGEWLAARLPVPD